MIKKCSKCSTEKDLSEFDFYKKRNYFSSYCKTCRKKKQNTFHKLHPEKNCYNSEYYKKYLASKPKNWAYLQVKKARERWSKQYNVTVSAISHHSLKIARLVFDKYDRKCNQCGSTERLAIHHIDGKGRNYTNKNMKPNNDINNLELLCIRCHGSIHGKIGGKKHGKKL